MSAFLADFSGAEVVPSPNFGERKLPIAEFDRPQILVLHYTAMASAEEACTWLCTSENEVSAHYLVAEDGHIIQMVPEAERAWHAGLSSWRGQTDINSLSIGIEIANSGHDAGCPDFPDAQMNSVIALCHSIIERHQITPQNIVGHSDIAPARKRDPGEWFDWPLLYQNGIGHYVDPAPISGGRYFMRAEQGQPIEALQSMLALYGYGIKVDGLFGVETEAVLTAFQRHFRPEKVDGIADMSTIDTLHRLLKALP